MKKSRVHIFVCLMTLGLCLIFTMNVSASVTKVGNGDDGSDLEALTPIKSGPIFKSRALALQLLSKLNIAGVPGLGQLAPEVERTELLMANLDVRPTIEQKGSLEISEDQQSVYARTFAEPYAATRFFPIALKLTTDQLIALHIHEALHRSLPSNIRTDENIVMHLTLAITSPGANFDRVYQVSKIYIKPEDVDTDKVVMQESKQSVQPVALPESSRTAIHYDYNFFSYGQDTLSEIYTVVHGLGVSKSIFGYREIKGYAVEPVFRARIKYISQYDEKFLGPSSYDIEARVKMDESTLMGPFLRFTAKSFDEGVKEKYGFEDFDRDIVTLGAFYRTEIDNIYLDSNISYSLPSSASAGGSSYWNRSDSIRYGAITTLYIKSGFNFGRWRLGATGDIVSFEGSESLSQFGSNTRSESTRGLLIGVEVGYSLGRFNLGTRFKTVVNSTTYGSGQVGDIMDHGSGKSTVGLDISLKL